ncbi:MAG: M20/M25/M40 family metallo-hydrolase [Pseudomonadota bacterium]
MTDSHAEIRNAAQEIKAQSLELLSELIVASTDARAIDRVTTRAMEQLGCAVESFDYAPKSVPLIDEFAAADVTSGTNETCLVGHLLGSGDSRSLLLFAHPDTEEVPPAPSWRSDPSVPTEHDGRLYGWGVADDLAGMAVLVQSVAVLRRAGMRPKGDVKLVSAPSKKHRRGISAALHRGLTADAAVYLHPAESGRGLDEIKAFAPGQLEFVITIEGKRPDTSEPAHTAFAHRAVNPLDKAMMVARALQDLDAERGDEVRHPRLQHAIGRSANLMLTHCEVGAPQRLSRIANACQLGGAMTLVPGESLDTVMAQVESAVSAVAAQDSWLAEHPPQVAWLAGVSAAETADEAPIYRTVANVLADLGAKPQVNPLHTSSDIRNPIVQKAIPTVGFGPRCGGLAMSGLTDEWVDVADYHRAIAATALIIASWCGVRA